MILYVVPTPRNREEPTLYQFAPTWGIPNLGQFNVKVETYLRMTKLPYKVVETLPLKGPKGKLPFIEDEGLRIADSVFKLNSQFYFIVMSM